MVSIIISSVNPAQLKQVSENIAATIEVPYEIIATDNSSGQKGICRVYNEAAVKAKYDILCFMHEDIIMQTQGWGNTIDQIFKNDTTIGLVGVVGSSYKTVVPSGWVSYGDLGLLHFNLLQSYKRIDKATAHEYNNPHNDKLTKVACVDGVWLCTTKKVWSVTRFDEELLTGFHAYDIDFSLAVNRHYDVVVTYDILLNHLSEGDFEKNWLADTVKIHQKWKPHLPLNIASLSKKHQLKMEWQTFKVFLRQLGEFGLKPLKYKNVLLNGAVKKLGLKLSVKIYYYLVKKSF